MKISVFGLGYVGTVSAACFAQQGHHVIGVDINPEKVKIVSNGRSPIIEADLNDIVSQGVHTGHLVATTDAAEAVQATDLSLVCVGTPSHNNGSLDLTFVERVCQEIGRAVAGKDSKHTVVLRSTVLPGTTRKVIIPILEQASGLIAGRGFGLSYNPEFLREGTSIHDFYHPPFTVIGELDPQSAEATASLYQDLDAPLEMVPLEAAEMVKYACNAFHALKVTFANEIGNLCKSQGIDSYRVMDIFCLDDKLNLSAYYLKPGFAFGGSCLPKDLKALLYHGRRLDQHLPVLEAILPSNRLQVEHGIEMIIATGHKSIGMLGFSFKAGTDDLRESPLVEVIETLLGKGYEIRIYDRNVSLARLHGANRAYIEREIPHIATLMCDSIDEVLSESDVIVIGNNSAEFRPVLKRARLDQPVIDLVRIMEDSDHVHAQYEGICW
ncbi:MAG: nucleotide sugar dehydrogenase [bacterium]